MVASCLFFLSPTNLDMFPFKSMTDQGSRDAVFITLSYSVGFSYEVKAFGQFEDELILYAQL